MGDRPTLPYRFANPYIKDHTTGPQLPLVKYQILTCQGKDILVGRLKIDTPTENGHAFILRRYDTGAISLTTMFRAAFPNASETDEKAEIQWVRDHFDLSGNNGSSKDPHIMRLAGTWVDPQLALEISKAYSLTTLIKTVVDAAPDPNGTYRRSGKSGTTSTPATSVVAPPITTPTSTIPTNTVQNSTIVVSKPPSTIKTLPTPSPTSTNPPAKRRKDASPAPSPVATSSIKPPSQSSPPPSASITATPGPRRSSRKSKSPAPRKMIPPFRRSPKKDKITRTPSCSELAAVDEEGQIVEDGVAGTELMEEDIKEQKRLITELRKKKEGESTPLKQADEIAMDESESASTSSKKRERENEDQPLTFDFKEPEKEERVIATNRRITRFDLEPRTKSFAWGVAAFAVGMGAVAFLPSLF